MPELVPEGTPTDFWDRKGVRWIFEPDTQLWHSEDPLDDHEPVVGAGAIEEDRQPTYGNPPNAAQRAHAAVEKEIEG